MNLLGEMKGVVTKVTMNDKSTVVTLHTASEEFLEIKVRVYDVYLLYYNRDHFIT